MTPDAAMSLGPAVTHQLLHLVVAALVALVVGAVPLLVGAWRRRAWPPATTAGRAPGVRGGWRTVGVAALAWLVLTAAVALRQLWPHPELRWPALVAVLGLIVVAAVGWLRSAAERRS
jgi:hypothetical protein